MAALMLNASALQSRKCVAQRPFTTALPVNRSAARLVTITEAKLSKASEFRNLPDEEITKQVEEGKKELFMQRMKFGKRENDYKPSEYKQLRRKVAQLLTVKREREIAQGITRRDARTAERQRLAEAGFGNI